MRAGVEDPVGSDETTGQRENGADHLLAGVVIDHPDI